MAKTNTIITIGREYGSAGRQIGYKVAEDLGIKLYDREMLERAAKESGVFSGYGFLLIRISFIQLYRHADQS